MRKTKDKADSSEWSSLSPSTYVNFELGVSRLKPQLRISNNRKKDLSRLKELLPNQLPSTTSFKEETLRLQKQGPSQTKNRENNLETIGSTREDGASFDESRGLSG